MTKPIFRFLLIAGCLLFVAGGILWSQDSFKLLGPVMAIAFGCIAIALQLKPSIRTFAFSLWVSVFVTLALAYPAFFTAWSGFQLKSLMVPLIQLIMFGMGTTLSIGDFSRVLAMPKAVLIGMGLQFTVMPLVGFMLAKTFGFPPEIAAGVVLIGSCPGGVASNVMTFISRGNVALSVTMTACSTLVSPLMTPLMMKLLAGQMINVPVVTMALAIIKMIIVPIVAGLVANKILEVLRLRGPWLDRLLSVVAMAAICFIIAIITAASRNELLGIGVALAAAAILHNTIGYLFGYFGGALFGLDESSRRTIAIEVGLQNGGMASGLALKTLNSANAALASAIFGPWMNISGSVLASYWRSRPIGRADPKLLRSKSA